MELQHAPRNISAVSHANTLRSGLGEAGKVVVRALNSMSSSSLISNEMANAESTVWTTERATEAKTNPLPFTQPQHLSQ